MKIGWATPLHHSSAIGQFSIGVTQALIQRGVEIDLIRTERASVLGEAHLPSELKIVNLAGMSDYRRLREYDVLAYNIGNNFDFHYYALDAALQIPGICIFHDVLIFNLFYSWMIERGEEDRAASVINDTYGSGTYPPLKPEHCHVTAAVANYSMLEWLAARALAAVAHGRHYLPRLLSSCAGPVRQIPLAYNLPARIGPLRARTSADTLRLTTIGHVNENKLAAEIILALGRSPRLRQRCAYRLVGGISDAMRSSLGRLAERTDVCLHMTGPLTRSALAAEIDSADALLCLRKPVLEGASASAIEAMLSGRPTIVLDHGFYQELPDELTLKIPADFKPCDLERQISWLLDNPEASRILGERAALWAKDTFSFQRYADAFLTLAEKALEAAPLLRLGTQLGQELSALGAGPDDPAAVRIAQMATTLFCPGGHLCRQI